MCKYANVRMPVLRQLEQVTTIWFVLQYGEGTNVKMLYLLTLKFRRKQVRIPVLRNRE